MRERIDLTEDDGASLVLLLPLLLMRKHATCYLFLSVCVLSLLLIQTSSSTHPHQGVSRHSSLHRSPNARTVFTPRETRRDRMCGGRTEGDCVSGGSLQKHCEWWDMGGGADQTSAGPADNAPTSLIAVDFAADR